MHEGRTWLEDPKLRVLWSDGPTVFLYSALAGPHYPAYFGRVCTVLIFSDDQAW